MQSWMPQAGAFKVEFFGTLCFVEQKDHIFCVITSNLHSKDFQSPVFPIGGVREASQFGGFLAEQLQEDGSVESFATLQRSRPKLRHVQLLDLQPGQLVQLELSPAQHSPA